MTTEALLCVSLSSGCCLATRGGQDGEDVVRPEFPPQWSSEKEVGEERCRRKKKEYVTCSHPLKCLY